MALELYFPQGILNNYVQMFWAWDHYHPPHTQERILPQGAMELTINLSSDGFNIAYPKNPNMTQHIDGMLLAGARTEYFVIDTAHPTDLLSVFFKIGATSAIFNLPANELTNQHISLEDLWGQKAIDLYEQLWESPNHQTRFRLIEQALLNQLQEMQRQHRAVQYALQVFQQTATMNPSVASVADEIGLSQTRFIHVFRQNVGLTPKKFTRLQRFQQALHLSVQTIDPDWADIAFQCGYFDQSHLINEFRALGGITPTSYAPQDSDHIYNLPYLT